MAFTRTPSGLGNQHLFHDVDCIVFVEGGLSLSKEQIDNGSFNDRSIDVLYWEQIFKIYKTGKVKFKAIGSKTAVNKIAENIVENNITTIYAAMDQEFDMVLFNNLIHSNVLYTHGYSWENDVWNEFVVQHIINYLSAENIKIENIKKFFKKFQSDIKFAVYADGHLFSKAKSFFPRPNGHMKLIECNVHLPPHIRKHEIERLIVDHKIVKSTVYNYGLRKKIDIRRNCYGHLLGDYCKNLIKHILKAVYNLSGISDEFIRRLAISCFLNYKRNDVNNYYEALFL